MKCDVIVVTYNSQIFLGKCLEALSLQTLQPQKIILVDTGSKDRSYLELAQKNPKVVVKIAEKESGFCHGNNVGYANISQNTDYVFFLNPDAFIVPDYIEKAIKFLEDPENHMYGAVTGMTLGYDIEKKVPTGKYDTTGIFKTWYGKWVDRGQGEDVKLNLYKEPMELPAICGAVFFCRKKSVDEVILKDKHVFDEDFYMYKEDIDLSIRLRKKGWKLGYDPDLLAYHCRGWNADRKKMPKRMRLHSARNELNIQLKTLNPIGVVYSLLKYTCVLFFNM